MCTYIPYCLEISPRRHFYFKALFDAVIIRGQLDFEQSLQRLTRGISRVAFNYWDELAKVCGDISRAAGF